MMPAACAAREALRDLLGDVERRGDRHRAAGSSRAAPASVLPSSISMTKYVDPSGSCPKSLMSMMCGLPMALAARASCRKRSVISLSRAISPRRTLMATFLSMTLCRPA